MSVRVLLLVSSELITMTVNIHTHPLDGNKSACMHVLSSVIQVCVCVCYCIGMESVCVYIALIPETENRQ